jgi:hypothetical protein
MIFQARYLKTAQAAIYCGRSVSYLEKLRAEGRGPAWIQPDGKKSIVYAIEDLDAWMSRYKVDTLDSLDHEGMNLSRTDNSLLRCSPGMR